MIANYCLIKSDRLANITQGLKEEHQYAQVLGVGLQDRGACPSFREV